ncbi:XRCC4-like factor-domain-containing protein [Phyllosticta capitalensis]|uniref:Non-homologous end-joining factor 1 n=1 Tax=Phyllosticta capitalensis TaxID=121624 RepID=A0ABR1YXR3_9PEZI
MDVPWVALKPSSLDASVRLFAKSQFTSSSYTVLITDLCNIWEETLDRKQILRRALELDTSIDPTEDSDQLQLLLEKIKNAIHGLKDTSIQVAHPGPDLALHFRLTTPLPAPLEDLKWDMRFAPSPVVSMKRHLTLPLITMAQEQHSQIEDLVGHLSAKDHVITKLLDKLEGTGFDLSSVFPGIAGTRGSKHSTTRQQIARQVHGVGAFDAEKWRSTRKPTSSTDYALVMSEIGSVCATASGETSNEQDWLARLPTEFGGARGEVSKSQATGSTNGTTAAECSLATQGTQDEDMFERQATPPRLRKSRPDVGQISTHSSPGGTATAGDSAEDETTDDDDLDAPPKKASQSRQDTQPSLVASQPESRASQSSPRKLGKLGGSRKTPPSSQTLSVPSQSEDVSALHGPKKLGRLGGPKKTSSADPSSQGNQSEPQNHTADPGTETESEADADEPKESKAIKEENPVTEPPKPLPKRGLGRLGGGRKPATGRESLVPRPDIASKNSPEIDGAPTTNRGTGSEREQGSPTSEAVKSVANASKGSPPCRKRTTPSVDIPQESEEQRANRKREELKRALESKSQPAKKKRKF